jgi:serine/threonine protein kinase
MTPDRWRRVNDLFHSALEYPRAEADAFLLAACANDEALYDEVRRMVDQASRSGLLDRSPWSAISSPSVADAAEGAVNEKYIEPCFHPGEVLACRYRLLRLLGRGGMGEVYEAEDYELHQEHVALKTLLPAIATDARMITRFKQELQLSRKIAHPNVCRVFDLTRHPADASASGGVTYFFTMELLAGETVSAFLDREGSMSPLMAIPLIEQMAAALEAAHSAGVIHRDFKPSNVMLVPSSAGLRAVVTDFGLARSLTPGEITDTRTTNLMGTVDYMAPELFTGCSATIATDIYALGMVAHKMLTSVLPHAEVSLPLDPAMQGTIDRALSRDPAARFASAADFLKSLRGESTAARFIAVPLTVGLSRRALLFGVPISIVLASSFAYLRYREQETLLAAGAASPLLMLTPFSASTDAGQNTERALALTLLMEKQLKQSRHIQVLTRDRILRGWKSNPDHIGEMPAALPPRIVREIAIREKANCVVFGSFSQVAEEWTIRIRLELMADNPEYPRRVRSHDFRDQDAASAAFDAVNWIRQMLTESSADLQARSRRPEELTTNNWHALQEYALGDDAWRRNDRPAALEHLREALVIDPEFALAAARLADLTTASGKVDEGMKYHEKAERLLIARNLTDRESLQIRGIFALDTGRYAEADHVFALWSQNFPDDALPRYYRSTVLDRLGRPDEAAPLLETAISRDPSSYVFAYRRAHRALLRGALDEAQSRCSEVARLSDSDWTDQLRAALAFGRLHFTEAWNHLERMRTTGSLPFQSRAMVYQACFSMDEGRLDDAARLLETALRFDRENGLAIEEQIAKVRRLAYVRLAMGRRAAASKSCWDAAESAPGLEATLRIGCVIARAGDPVGAKALLPSGAPQWPVHLHWYMRLRAEIALAHGKAFDALNLMRSAPPPRSEAEWPLYLALAAEAAGDADTLRRLLTALFASPAKYWYYAEASEPGFLREALMLADKSKFRPEPPDDRKLDALATYFTRR